MLPSRSRIWTTYLPRFRCSRTDRCLRAARRTTSGSAPRIARSIRRFIALLPGRSDAILLREHLGHDSLQLGIGKIEQAAVARHPLIGVEQACDLPGAVD